MKPYIKIYSSKISDKLFFKDMAIATLLVAFLLTNDLFIFKGWVQWLLSVPALWIILIGLLWSIDNMTINNMNRTLLKNINEHITGEILDFKENDDEDIA